MSSRRRKVVPVTDEAPDVVQEQPPVEQTRVITVADLMGGPAMLPAYHTAGLTPGERRARDERNALLDQGLWWD